ncbi:MAG TPA: polyhydroxyalkanoate depolymerase [Casimicrobiaceae bacterium]|jgi:polyhydroxyalkanoate depolymerase
MIYQTYQAQSDSMWPLRALATAAIPILDRTRPTLSGDRALRKIAAACEVVLLAALTHRRPPFRIDCVVVGDAEVAVHEETVTATPFATLLHFRKDVPDPGPRVLVVAPMSGHFATLLRDTVQTMLRDHDVYITDWHNARDVPLAAGRFGLDEYTAHIVDFIAVLGPGANVMAICQPCVAVLAAVALMSAHEHPATPSCMVLMAGPIDCRISPTTVNVLATDKPIEWFEKKLIATVPVRYAGAMRRVYPGFLQLSAFLNMNLDRHIAAFRGFFEDVVNNQNEKAEATRSFYREYFAVADLPAEFYLETVKRVFQDYALAKGELTWRDERIALSAIRRTALLTIEGERDDICSLGQTLAAHDLCSGLRPYMKTHYVQPGAGHYGVFSGRRWSGNIYPVVRDVIHVSR